MSRTWGLLSFASLCRSGPASFAGVPGWFPPLPSPPQKKGGRFCVNVDCETSLPPGGGGTWVRFCWICATGLASQNSHHIIFYSVANYRPHLSHFWANVIVISTTEFNASRLLNIKTTAGTIFQPRIFLFLNACLPEFSYPKNPENFTTPF